MHCNLRPPDVTPVVLSFNYETYDETGYKLNISATSANPQCTNVAYQISDNPRPSYF